MPSRAPVVDPVVSDKIAIDPVVKTSPVSVTSEIASGNLQNNGLSTWLPKIVSTSKTIFRNFDVNDFHKVCRLFDPRFLRNRSLRSSQANGGNFEAP
jgi:hypothetical protein